MGVALLIQFTAPLFVALFARFVYHEPIRRRIWLALALALCIVGLSIVVELWSGSGFAAVFWAIVQPLWSFPWGVLDERVSLEGNLSDRTAPVWVLLAFVVVVVGTMITFSLLTGALRHIPATRASIVATLEPVVATVVAWLWLGESFGPSQLVGGAVVLGGIILAQTSR